MTILQSFLQRNNSIKLVSDKEIFEILTDQNTLLTLVAMATKNKNLVKDTCITLLPSPRPEGF